MSVTRMIVAAALQLAVLGAQEVAVTFDLVHCGCGCPLTLEQGWLMLVNSYLVGTPWGLLRTWMRSGNEWSARGLTLLGPIL